MMTTKPEACGAREPVVRGGCKKQREAERTVARVRHQAIVAAVRGVGDMRAAAAVNEADERVECVPNLPTFTFARLASLSKKLNKHHQTTLVQRG